MARGRKGKGAASVKVDFTGVETRKLVPENDYAIKPVEISQETSGDKNPYLAWTFEISRGDHKGSKLYYNTSLLPQALWNLRGVLEAFGMEVPDGKMELDLKEMVEGDYEACATVEHDTYNGKKQARITDINSIDTYGEGDGEEGDGDAGEAPDEDEVNAMDEEELETTIDEFELDVDLDDFKGIKKKRAAVIKALAEREEDDGEGDGDGDGEGDSELPDEDAIKGMDEDELQEVIDEHELDVDLDDFKGIKKKRAAVIKAVEEAGEGDGDDGDDGEDGDDDKYDADEVNEMDGDELAEVVKKHKLKVKLSGKEKKDRKAVLKALEEADLIEDDE